MNGRTGVLEHSDILGREGGMQAGRSREADGALWFSGISMMGAAANDGT